MTKHFRRPVRAASVAAAVLSALLGASCGGGSTSSVTGGFGPAAPTAPYRGVFSIFTDPNAINANELSNPSVDGFNLRADWTAIEPSEGAYDWSYFDAQIARAAQAGKHVSLSVPAGDKAPAWVYADGAAAFSTVATNKLAGTCTPAQVPIPWDPVFLAKWLAFIQAFGVRYGSNGTVAVVKLTGINDSSEEFVLPHDQGGTQDGCAVNQDVSEWQADGYTSTKVQTAFTQIAQAWTQAFPNAKVALMANPTGFPPLDANGSMNPASIHLGEQIVQSAAQTYGAQFVPQNNALSAVWDDPVVAGLHATNTIGFQMLWSVTNDPTCAMNGGVSPCDPLTDLTAAVTRGINAGASYLEIYSGDVNNAALASAIAQAHAGLR